MDDSRRETVCLRCCQCCREYPFVEVSKAEVIALGEASGLDPDVFAHRKGDSDEYFLKFKDNGDCYFLSDDPGAGCAVYEARAEVCRAYPGIPSQDERCAEHQERILGVKRGD